jgi:hypothetical protein
VSEPANSELKLDYHQLNNKTNYQQLDNLIEAVGLVVPAVIVAEVAACAT